MLELLRIHNLALIEDLEMELSTGMNVLTGETGAGKSFILKAINFLTGDKLTTDLIRPGFDKAVVEGLFWINDQEYILRRELMADTGRSRFYINNALSSQEAIKDLRASLLLHTSQHGQQKLLQAAFQAKILDDYINKPDIFIQKDDLVAQLQGIVQERKKIEAKVADILEKRDVLEYQLQEIAKVNPKHGEEEELENIRNAVRNQAGISDSIGAALTSLHGGEQGTGIFPALASFEKAVITLNKYAEGFSDVQETMLDIRNSMQDIERRLKGAAQQNSNTYDIEQVEERLYAIAQLKRKLKRPLEAILNLQQELTESLEFLDNCELQKKDLAIDEIAVCEKLAIVLQTINSLRQEKALLLCSAIEQELIKLGFSEHVHVLFSFTPTVLHPDHPECTELKAKLLWQPNPGQTEQPLDKIASGGELSRFLLAVVTLISRNSDEKPMLIFDEVDAGVGGITLNRVAESLAELALNRQMLLITHWPQLAKKGQRHFVVTKKVINAQTFTECKQLSQTEIQEELARMTGLEATV